MSGFNCLHVEKWTSILSEISGAYGLGLTSGTVIPSSKMSHIEYPEMDGTHFLLRLRMTKWDNNLDLTINKTKFRNLH